MSGLTPEERAKFEELMGGEDWSPTLDRLIPAPPPDPFALGAADPRIGHIEAHSALHGMYNELVEWVPAVNGLLATNGEFMSTLAAGEVRLLDRVLALEARLRRAMIALVGLWLAVVVLAVVLAERTAR